MARYEVTAPDGSRYEITAPDNATEDQIMQYAQQQFAQANSAPKTDPTTGEVISDVAKSAGVGLAQGVLGLTSLPGNLEALGRAGINAGAGLLGYQENVVDPETVIPDYGDYKTAVEGVTGKFYEPKTVAGQYARTVGEFAPAAVGGPAGMLNRAARVVAPAVASETAGQLAEGTGYEGVARAVGGLAGGFVPGAGMPRVKPRKAADPLRRRAVETLEKEGVTAISAGQKTGSETIRGLEDAANSIPFSGQKARKLDTKAAEQFTGAVLKRVLRPQVAKDLKARGINPSRASEEVMDAIVKDFGARYQALAPKLSIVPDPALLNKIAARGDQYRRGAQAGQVREGIADLASDLAKKGPLTGKDAATYLSNLKESARNMPGDWDAKNALMDMIGDIQENIFAQARSRGGAQAEAALRKEFKTLNKNYRNFISVEDAVFKSAADQAAKGVITPAKLRQAVKSQGKRQMVTGKNDFSKLSRAGNEVLTPLKSSGTAERSQYLNVLNNPFSLGGSTTGAALGTAVAGVPGMVVGGLAGMSAPGLISRLITSNQMQDLMTSPYAAMNTRATLLPGIANRDYNEEDEAMRLGRALMMQGR